MPMICTSATSAKSHAARATPASTKTAGSSIPPTSSRVDVGPELGGIRLGLGGGEVGGLGDDGADRGFDLLEALLGAVALLGDAALNLLDGVPFRAHRGDFLLAAVLSGVGHGVAAIAIGQHLEDVRPVAVARMR